jgi:hypothetical protein
MRFSIWPSPVRPWDEFIIPDFTMGSMPRRKDTCDLFIEEVVPSFR